MSGRTAKNDSDDQCCPHEHHPSDQCVWNQELSHGAPPQLPTPLGLERYA